jgi:flagellar protein FlaJ
MKNFKNFHAPFQARVKYLLFTISGVILIAIMIAGYQLAGGFSYMFHVYLGFGLSISLLAPALIYHFEFRRQKRIDDALPQLLDDIAESHQAGMTLLQAIEESAKRNYGPITKDLKQLSAQLSWGVEFEVAFKLFAKRISTSLSVKVTTLLIETVRLGGDLKRSFGSTARFVRELLRLRNERDAQLRYYLMIIYASTMIFVLLVVVLYNSFFLPMTYQSTQFIPITMSLEESRILLFDMAIVEALFGGLTAGKLSQGRVLNGLKHSVILIALVSAILLVFF